ncbi:MAG: hypothetical protein KAI24_19140 [Planctomycetes bacterium]|nr:hypothetical protein [Planctomycetota bacterium]
MGGTEQRWVQMVAVARRFLRRYRDATTRHLREDLAQEAAMLAWQWADRIADESRLEAAVRTIARRLRARTLRARVRRGRLQFVPFGEADVDDPVARTPDERSLRIGARAVPVGWAVGRLGRVLRCLSELDQRLLLGFHEGFCCAELASRFGRTEDCVKTRIHRARRRVQHLFEGMVREAGPLDDHVGEESQG